MIKDKSNNLIKPLDQNNYDSTPIQEFYKNQSIFITGGTGFIGKVLIEKLLRSCPDISCIYILIRLKKGKNIKDRMKELFNDPIYYSLKNFNLNFHKKIVGISGDCNTKNLGLSDVDKYLLINNVSVVFHVAASVRFYESLKYSTIINVQATDHMINLCQKMPKLKAFIHVSTAYANCIFQEIDEKFYDYPIKNQELLSLVYSLSDNILNDITPRIISPWPNTYSFTKAIAEDLIKTKDKNLPVGIFRPGIVLSTMQEPIPGWTDNFYGPTAVISSMATGILHTIHCDPLKKGEYVPVDYTVNALIVSAWDVAMQTVRQKKNTLIYNFVSSVDAPYTWGDFFATNEMYIDEYPINTAVWYKFFMTNKHKFFHSLFCFLMHIIPAAVIDTLTMCYGRKPYSQLKMYKKIHKYVSSVSYFSTREWKFKNNNVQNMWNRLDLRDRQIFYFTMDKFDWKVYLKNYIKGIRVYLLKDDLSTIVKSKIKWRRFYWMHQVLKGLLMLFGFLILWNIFFTIFKC